MTKKKNEHCIIRNNKLFCSNCGTYEAIPFPVRIPVFSVLVKEFSKQHARCPKTYKEPEFNQTQSIDQRARQWFERGERGASSESIFKVITGEPVRADITVPQDPDDFRRCYLLLKAIPEWRKELSKMAEYGHAWKNLVGNWDKLTGMLEEQMATKKPNGMYEFMQVLIK